MKGSRRNFIQGAGAGAALVFAQGGPLPGAGITITTGRPRPNILFIWTDEQNFGMLSCEGNPHIETPNLDRLAREGTMFTNSFCTYPSCSPSRATVVTGAYAFNHRLCDNVHVTRGLEGITPADGYRLTQQYLQDAGYAIGHKGKWHAGKKSDWGATFTADPDFSETYAPSWVRTYRDEVLEQYPWDDQTKTGAGGYVKGKTYYPTRLTNSWQPAFDAGTLPDWALVGELLLLPEKTLEFTIVEDTIEFIEKHKDQSWMATLSLSPPHDPWHVPEPYFSDVAKPLMNKMEIVGNADEKDQRNSLSWRVGQLTDDQGIKDYMAIYMAQVVMMDDFIGKVLDALDENGLTEDTLVVFTSDHGDMHGLHRNVGKINHNLYNRLFHVPCIFRYPGKITAGQVIDQPIMHTDFKPTFLDYAGVTPSEPLPGCSLRPLLEGQNPKWRDYHLLEKFIGVERNPDHSFKENDFYYAFGIEEGRYKYIYTRFHNPEKNRRVQRYLCGPRFIDVKNDPYEETNLFDDPAYRELIQKYHTRLHKILSQNKFQFIDEYSDDPWKVRDPS